MSRWCHHARTHTCPRSLAHAGGEEHEEAAGRRARRGHPPCTIFRGPALGHKLTGAAGDRVDWNCRTEPDRPARPPANGRKWPSTQAALGEACEPCASHIAIPPIAFVHRDFSCAPFHTLGCCSVLAQPGASVASCAPTNYAHSSHMEAFRRAVADWNR